MKQKILFIIKGMTISSTFSKKLTHNFHELTALEMIVYLIFIRPFWNRHKRFFFEGSLGLIGQMYITERKTLFTTIQEKKPRQCFEIGTYTGGGSTYFIAKAFEKNGSGKLITLENNPHYYTKAKNYYTKKLPATAAYVDFIFGETAKDFDSTIRTYKDIDCVFLDGAEDGKQTLDQYNYFLPYFHKGTVLIIHDWNTEKTRLIKPVIMNSNKWRITTELKPPLSVGLIVAEML